LRQPVPVHQPSAGADELIDAAIAVNAAPSLQAAFQVLADTGLALLGADRMGVTEWDAALIVGKIVAAAGEAQGDVGATISSSTQLRTRLRDGGAYVGPASDPGAELAPAVATVVAVGLPTARFTSMIHAGFNRELAAEEGEAAAALLERLARLTSIAERSLREHERHRFDSVLDGIADGVIFSNGVTATANQAARAILGLTSDDEIRRDSLRFRKLDGSPVDWPVAPGRYKTRATSLDGRELVLDGTFSLVEGGSVSVFRDVTDEHAQTVLNERTLRALFNSLPIPLSVASAKDFSILSVNQAFLDLVGYPRDRVEGATPPYVWWADGESTSTGMSPGTLVHRSYRRPDRFVLPVEVATHGVRGDDDELELLLTIVTDLSEKRLLDQQLVQSGKLAAIGQLAAGVAHEINNPLFAILALTEFLIKDSVPGTKQYERLELIQETGLEIKEIVRALLDFARENADERHVVSLQDVIRSTVDLIRRTNAHKGVELIDTYDDSGALVNASANQLKQVFLNLAANARQAMPNGGTIRVDMHRAGNSVIATVSDDGPGIEPDVLERIFDPFFTTKRDTGGTGLGLPVSLGIAEMHGGSLTATSEPGQGATFTLRLPVVEAA
jgi:PAS domain S-box-containing protein